MMVWEGPGCDRILAEGAGRRAATQTYGGVWLFRSCPGLVRPLADPFEHGVGPRFSEPLDPIEVIGQLRHRHVGAQTVVEGDDRFAMAAHLEVGRVRDGIPCTPFEEQPSDLTGVDQPRPKLLVLGGQRRIGVGTICPLPSVNVSGITHRRAQPLTGRTMRSGRPLVNTRGVFSICWRYSSGPRFTVNTTWIGGRPEWPAPRS